ncbi:hypothetical protein NVP1081O_168 [Vibrio phage 1.081.O._10N.286.52.C2]|nr:hypothetical protein NVP1081O_168 [Vibrio phage 1.081.O._10N.286.52.C2]
MSTKQNTAIFIGRFRPFHRGHLSAITQAFAELNLDRMTILVGSSNRHRSPKNPFNFDEVFEMMTASIPKELLNKIHFAPLSDHAKDDAWAAQVRERGNHATHIVGYDKDESSYYLKMFPEMKLFQPVPWSLHHTLVNATDVRNLYFDDYLFNCNGLINMLPQGTIDFLDKWRSTEHFDLMKAEYESSLREVEKLSVYPYKDHLNIACADNVVICAGHVLLVERKFSPGKGCLAIPGGHKSEHETFLTAAVRELQEETSIKVPEKALRGSVVGEKMFDDPKRSFPHTRISMAYHYDIKLNPDGTLPKVTAGDDAMSARWYTLSDVTAMQSNIYDDHYQIIQHFTGI